MKPGAEVRVVIVPDFTGETPTVFEARALFFLASWLETFGEGGGGSGRYVPHLGCIGEPPGSVRWLAQRAGAGLTVHRPVEGLWGGFANKLRGLEVPGTTAAGQRVLLLDADVLVLGGVETLDEVEADFAAAPAGKPQVPLAVWELIYRTLGVPLPTERMASVRGALGLGVGSVAYPYPGQGSELEAMLPYYNSGVLLARQGSGLRETWESHLRTVAGLAAQRVELAPLHAVIYGDQVALATSLQALRARGYSCDGLPTGFNARMVQLRAGALRWEDLRLFHATGFLRGLRGRETLGELLEQYAQRWAGALREGGGSEEEAGRPRRYLGRLWERWVAPAWKGQSLVGQA